MTRKTVVLDFPYIPQGESYDSFVNQHAKASQLPEQISFPLYQTHLSAQPQGSAGGLPLNDSYCLYETKVVEAALERSLPLIENFRYMMGFALVMALRKAVRAYQALPLVNPGKVEKTLDTIAKTFASHSNEVATLAGYEPMLGGGDGLDALVDIGAKAVENPGTLDSFFN